MSNFRVLRGYSVVEHVKKMVDVLESVSELMKEFSGEENHLVENAFADPEMIYSTNDQNEIQQLQSIAPNGKKKGVVENGKTTPTMTTTTSKRKRLSSDLEKWDAKFKEYRALSGFPARGTTWYNWQRD